jgi:hypothetical protein
MFAALLSGADLKYTVRHEHLHKGGEGQLTVTTQSIAFFEGGKNSSHSRVWKLSDIQELELSPTLLRIRTYEDIRSEFGRDREFRFDKLPPKMALEVYRLLAPQMDQRLIARVADADSSPLWTMPAKVLRGYSGSNGTLTVAVSGLIFESPHDSRTWRIADIQGVASENEFELTVSSLDGDTRLQLKERLSEDRYNDLWQRISEAHGLKPFQSRFETHHE